MNAAMKRTRILVADDHSIILAGIRNLIEQDWELAGHVEDGRSLVEAALKLRPDLIILDIGMPVLNGIDAAKQIRKAWPEAKLLFLTMHTSPIYLRLAMRAGGSGYVLKTSAAEELRPAIAKVLKGQVYVSAKFGPDIVGDAADAVREAFHIGRRSDRPSEGSASARCRGPQQPGDRGNSEGVGEDCAVSSRSNHAQTRGSLGRQTHGVRR